MKRAIEIGLGVLLLVAVLLGARTMLFRAEKRAPIPAPVLDEKDPTATARWPCLQAGVSGAQSVDNRVKGVRATTAGYSGGTRDTATYSQVSTETTSHAESVKIVYDPSKVSYGTLLRIFFKRGDDPTQLNRQGPDVGTSYRSAIFYATPEQQQIAAAYIAQLEVAKVFPKPIVMQEGR